MLTKIQDLALEDVRLAVADALRGELDLDALADFVASVDWSGFEAASAEVRNSLGELESSLTAFEEDEITLDEALARLVAVFPGARERSRDFTLAEDRIGYDR
jgi:hypothetical protein